MGNDSGESEFNFKKENTLEERKKIFNNIQESNPGKIPVVIEEDKSSKLNDSGTLKFILKREDTISILNYLVRKRLNILNIGQEESSLMFLADKRIISFEISIGEVYDKYKESDGFLYLTYSKGMICG